MNPEFITGNEANELWVDCTRFLLAKSRGEVEAYSVKELRRSEIVNDVLMEQRILAAFCVLADLDAIYERNYGDKELSFTLSGYT